MDVKKANYPDNVQFHDFQSIKSDLDKMRPSEEVPIEYLQQAK